MPEFIPNHTPTGIDDFTRGYLECAEWLATVMSDRPDNSLTSGERDRCKGFTREAVRDAKRDCAGFMKANAADLTLYEEHVRPLSRAGMDFWLTRNGHGAGFWDRKHCGSTESDQALDRLTDAADAYGPVECELYKGWLHMTGG